jgi:hypothetical protein
MLFVWSFCCSCVHCCCLSEACREAGLSHQLETGGKDGEQHKQYLWSTEDRYPWFPGLMLFAILFPL